MEIVLIILFSYMIGNISPSYIFAKKYKNIDIRNVESGNAGTTNALRVMGKKVALFVFLVDFFKGFLLYLGIYILLCLVFGAERE